MLIITFPASRKQEDCCKNIITYLLFAFSKTHFIYWTVLQHRTVLSGELVKNFIMKKILVIRIFMLPFVWSKEIKVFNLPGNEESFLKMVKDPGLRDFKAISMCMR